MTSASWSMGSGDEAEPVAEVPTDRVLVAEVSSSGAVEFAPRTLRLYVSGGCVAIRDLEGALLWLETDDESAFPDPEQPGNVRVVRHEDGHGSLLPRDTAAEFQAMVSLEAICGWADAAVISTELEPAGADPGMRVVLSTRDRRRLDALVDTATGVVLWVHGDSIRGELMLEMAAREVRPRTPDAFAAV